MSLYCCVYDPRIDSLKTITPISSVSPNHREVFPLTIRYQAQEPIKVSGLGVYVVEIVSTDISLFSLSHSTRYS